jgi:hypothetical protein
LDAIQHIQFKDLDTVEPKYVGSQNEDDNDEEEKKDED